MFLTYKEYFLNEENIDVISAELQTYLKRLNLESRNIQRIRLTVEEMLLSLLANGNRPEKLGVFLGRQFGRHILRLRYEMEPFDPTKASGTPWADDLMRSLGVFPTWSHRREQNTVSLVLADRPKRGTLFYLLLAALAAALLGLGGVWFPDTLRQAVDDALLTPLAEAFLGLLKTFSGLMIVLTLCSGILGMGDSASLGRMGKSVLLRFIGISLAVSAVSCAMVLPFLHLTFTDTAQGQSSPLVQISRMFFDILPTDPVTPFQTGNALQLLVIAFIFGVGLLAIGDRGNRLRDVVNDASSLLQNIISAICALVPAFVFVTLLRQFWAGQIKILLSILKPLLLIVGSTTGVTAVLWVLSAIRLKCPPMLLLKKALPPFLIAFTTASSVSAMPLAMEVCEMKLGVEGRMVSFAYPLGSVIFMPSSVIYFTVLCCALAETYQAPISLAWLLTAAVTAALVAIAMPPIPGADILSYTLLFSSLGIPSEALVLATAVDIVIDFLDTGYNVLNLILQIACEAGRQGALDRSILQNRET